MARLFDGFKDTLKTALNDPDFRRKNTLLQDPDLLATYLDRVDALTPDVSILLDYNNVISALGLAKKNANERVVEFEPSGFETTLSAFREGDITTPRRFWLRANAAVGEARYLLSDGGAGAVTSNGVMALSPELEVLYRFPHFGSDLVGSDEYEDSADAITFTVGTTEYIAIACTAREVVQIYEFADPYTYIATLGVIDTPEWTREVLPNRGALRWTKPTAFSTSRTKVVTPQQLPLPQASFHPGTFPRLLLPHTLLLLSTTTTRASSWTVKSTRRTMCSSRTTSSGYQTVGMIQ